MRPRRDPWHVPSSVPGFHGRGHGRAAAEDCRDGCALCSCGQIRPTESEPVLPLRGGSASFRPRLLPALARARVRLPRSRGLDATAGLPAASHDDVTLSSELSVPPTEVHSARVLSAPAPTRLDRGAPASRHSGYVTSDAYDDDATGRRASQSQATPVRSRSCARSSSSSSSSAPSAHRLRRRRIHSATTASAAVATAAGMEITRTSPGSITGSRARLTGRSWRSSGASAGAGAGCRARRRPPADSRS
jgi:hypothetical protein